MRIECHKNNDMIAKKQTLLLFNENQYNYRHTKKVTMPNAPELDIDLDQHFSFYHALIHSLHLLQS